MFGDSVCRGCRRYNPEVMYWNALDYPTTLSVWQRLDKQLDTIVIPECAIALPALSVAIAREFLSQITQRLPGTASNGRYLYEVLRACERNYDLTRHPCLANTELASISQGDLLTMWRKIDHQLYTLATAQYDLEWSRALTYQQGRK